MKKIIFMFSFFKKLHKSYVTTETLALDPVLLVHFDMCFFIRWISILIKERHSNRYQMLLLQT